MKIIINGQPKTVDNQATIETILTAEGMASMKVAVALNANFIAKNDYTKTTISEGDAIEIVAPMQGG